MGKTIYPMEVEEIMCGFYLEYPNDWRQHLDELMNRLNAAGYSDYDKGNIKDKVEDYHKIATGYKTSHYTRKSIATYKRLTARQMEGIDSFVKEVYGINSLIIDYDVEASADYFRSKDSVAFPTNPSFTEFKLNTSELSGSKRNPPSFSALLGKYIFERNPGGPNGKYSDIYNKVRMDRKTFNHMIEPNPTCKTKKNLIILAIAFELSYEETVEFLATCGFGLYDGYLLDVIIMHALKNKIYDIDEIDKTICDYNMPDKTLFSTN